MATATAGCLNLRFRVLPKQAQFLAANDREVFYSGAYGAAKSTALCLKLLMHAAIPGNFVGLCRKTMPALKSSTVRTLIEGDASMPPALPYDSDGKPCFTWNKTDGLIQLHGGGKIKLFSLDEETRLRSYAFGAIGIDEVTELTESEYMTLMGRIRLPIYDGTSLRNQVFSASNPDAPTHWAYGRFFGPDASRHDRKVITTRSFDNPYLVGSYADWLASLTGQQRDRYVEGKWVSFGGAFYENFQRDKHLVHRDIGDFVQFRAGIDDGCVHPACIIIAGEDADGRLHVVQEWYERGHTHGEIADMAERFQDHYELESWAPDPSAAGLREELMRRNLPIVDADNDRYLTSRLLYDALNDGPDGRPRLTIDPGVRMLPLELESIEPHPTRNEPKKTSSSDGSIDPRDGQPIAGGMDHAHDALRYLLSSIPGTITGYELWMSDGRPSNDDEDDGWELS